MIAFEVYMNGARICTAGIGNFGVLSSMLTWRGSQPYRKGGRRVAESLELAIGGLDCATEEHLYWQDLQVKPGDEIRIRIVQVATVDHPSKRKEIDRGADLRAEKRYVRQMAKQLGWKLQTGK